MVESFEVASMEVWRDVPGYEGLYQVSNLGRIKRLFCNGNENFLQGKHDKDGYITVILSRKQTKKYCRLHRLIAKAFIPNPGGKAEVNHKDRNKRNNEVSNLEWVTPAENTRHCIDTGRPTHKRAILQYTKDMELIAVWDSLKEAAKQLNIGDSNICSCCAGRLKTSGGYIWRYKEVSF
jgi:hypothetical protein